MVNKKIIYGVIILFGVLTLISFVSAKHTWWHFWGDDDVQTAPFDATVSLSNAPPEIVSVQPVRDDAGSDPCPSTSGIDGDIQPCASDVSSTNEVELIFIVEDPNGPGDLPGPAGGDGAPALTAGDISITFDDPTANGFGAISRTANGLDCSTFECASGTNQNCDGDDGGTDITNQKQYTCIVDMNYYDPPAIDDLSAANMWHIQIIASDIAAEIDTYRSDDIAFDQNRYMEYLEITGVDTTADISWTNIDINTEDIAADGPLTLDNAGNVAVKDTNVQGEDLTGVNDPVNAIMEVEAFSVGSAVGGIDSGSCDVSGAGGPGSGGSPLVESSPELISVGVPYTASGSDTNSMYFCIWDDLGGTPDYLDEGTITDTSYSATEVKGNNWEVVFNS